MKFNLNHGKEFAKILGKADLKAEAISPDGNFLFAFTKDKSDSKLVVDPGMIAGLIQLQKAVDRGDTPEEKLTAQIAAVCAELKI